MLASPMLNNTIVPVSPAIGVAPWPAEIRSAEITNMISKPELNMEFLSTLSDTLWILLDQYFIKIINIGPAD